MNELANRDFDMQALMNIVGNNASQMGDVIKCMKSYEGRFEENEKAIAGIREDVASAVETFNASIAAQDERMTRYIENDQRISEEDKTLIKRDIGRKVALVTDGIDTPEYKKYSSYLFKRIYRDIREFGAKSPIGNTLQKDLERVRAAIKEWYLLEGKVAFFHECDMKRQGS